MKNWEEHWNTVPQTFLPSDFLAQVGKTVCGKPISDGQFKALLSDISNSLQFQPDDSVLDLCCGNGLITNHVSSSVGAIYGVDYSEPLIKIAKTNHKAENVFFLNQSVLELHADQFETKFNAIYMYEALQHFSEAQLSEILSMIDAIRTPGCRLFFGSIPDRDRRWVFYNTWPRRWDFMKRSVFGNEAIGTWWSKATIQKIAEAHGYRCDFREQNKTLHTAHYRFDVLLTAQKVTSNV